MYYMVFDVESIGLYGEGFAVGYVVLSEFGVEVEAKFFSCSTFSAQGTTSDRKWVNESIPPIYITHDHPQYIRDSFWKEWMRWKDQGTTLWADCAYPVETKFLMDCVMDNYQDRKYEGPYPLHEIATVLNLAGMHPLAKYPRLETELPIHNPVADARQSARLLMEALKIIRSR